jgi:hypothetical protein
MGQPRRIVPTFDHFAPVVSYEFELGLSGLTQIPARTANGRGPRTVRNSVSAAGPRNRGTVSDARKLEESFAIQFARRTVPKGCTPYNM